MNCPSAEYTWGVLPFLELFIRHSFFFFLLFFYFIYLTVFCFAYYPLLLVFFFFLSLVLSGNLAATLFLLLTFFHMAVYSHGLWPLSEVEKSAAKQILYRNFS